MSDLASAQPQLHPHDSDASSSEQISTDKAEELTQKKTLNTSGKGQLTQCLQPPRCGFNLKSPLKIALVVILATSYLTFCFIVRHRTIPIGGNGVTVQGLPFNFHFTTEASITTIAILIISVALWPISGLVDEIRSEEFFRLLRSHANGVPLNSANAISAPITGPFDVILATIRRHCSGHLTSTLAITLAIIATSSLAPSVLHTAPALIDIDNDSFMIGAVPPGAFLNSTIPYSFDVPITGLFPKATTMSWVEYKLNFTTAYYQVASSEEDPFGWIVPFPPEYTTTTRAYWTTDIIIINPSCSWQTASTPGFSSDNLTWSVTLSQPNSESYLPVYNSTFGIIPQVRTMVSVPRLYKSSNYSILVSDGSTCFAIYQFNRYGTLPPALDFSKIPTLRLPNEYNLAFLVCSPHASIQTYEVRTTGNGIIYLGQPQRIQGNLDFDQINYLLSWVLRNFDTDSGPHQSGFSEMMVQLIFGDSYNNAPWWDATANPHIQIVPAPLANITAVYKRVIQSAMKALLSGAIAQAKVPGGFTVERVVFKSSSGHLVTSTILFVLLTLALVLAQFRTGREAFTLIDVAAALMTRMCRGCAGK